MTEGEERTISVLIRLGKSLEDRLNQPEADDVDQGNRWKGGKCHQCQAAVEALSKPCGICDQKSNCNPHVKPKHYGRAPQSWIL